MKEQVVAHAGQRWEAMVGLPAMNRDQAETWIAFLMAMKGGVGTFLMGDPLGQAPRGAGGGTPVVSGAAQTGDELVITGAPLSTTAWLKAGDYIQLGSGATTTIHKTLTDTDTNGAGAATLDIWPAMRTAPTDAATVVISGTVGLFRINSPEMSWDVSELRVYGITFSAVEAIT